MSAAIEGTPVDWFAKEPSESPEWAWIKYPTTHNHFPRARVELSFSHIGGCHYCGRGFKQRGNGFVVFCRLVQFQGDRGKRFHRRCLYSTTPYQISWTKRMTMDEALEVERKKYEQRNGVAA